MTAEQVRAEHSGNVETFQRTVRGGFLHIFLATITRNPFALVSLAFLIFMVVALLLVPLLPLRDPEAINPVQRLVPWAHTTAHPLGTDELGRDLLSRLFWGGRVSMVGAVLASALSILAGVAIGIIAGYAEGVTDNLIMRLIDILMAFPALILAIAVVAALGPGLRNSILVLGIIGIPIYARVVRGVVLSLKAQPFVDAAKSLGANDLRIILFHLLPNTLAPIIVLFTLDVGQKIVFMAGMSFVGLGTQPPTSDWGAMLASASSYVTTAPYAATLPGLAIFAVVLALNTLGDGLRDTLDPRLSRQ